MGKHQHRVSANAFLFGWFCTPLPEVNFATVMRSLRIIPVVALLTGLLVNMAGKDPDSLMVLVIPDSVSEAQVRLRLELANEISNRDISSAIGYAREALDDVRELDSPRLEAEARLAIGRFYDYLGVRKEAIDHLLEALHLFKELEDPRNQANTLMYIGNAYWYLRQFESAQDCYSQVSQIGEILQDTTLIISGLNARGAVDGNTGRMESARVLFQRAIALAREYGSMPQEILSYFNLGDVTLYSGNPDEALVIFLDLEHNYDIASHDSKYLGSLYNSMTSAYLRKGQIGKAREYSAKTRDALDRFPRLTENKDYFLYRYRIDTAENNTRSALDNYIMYTRLNDSLNDAKFRERMANLTTYNDLRDKETEIARLKLDNQVKDLEIRQRMTISYGSAALAALLGIIAFLLIRDSRRMRRNNQLLESANEKISKQSMDLVQKNEALENLVEELKATQQHLVHSEKMASLGTLTSGVAHEINNPLNFISGGLELIRETLDTTAQPGDRALQEKRNKALNMAAEGLERASGIVRALMTFSFKGRARRVESDLHEIIDNTLLFLNSKISGNIRIVKEYGLSSKVSVFPDRMHQVVMNIIDNALFALNASETKDKLIRITTREEGGKVALRISNNGPPVKEEHLHRLFDPFFTTKDPGQGTGLGLSISYNLVKEHKGTIRVENQPGDVAFIIEIPL